MSTMAIGGGGLSAQLMYAMNEMSKDLRTELRERAEQEAQAALREGLAEAEEMHEKAGDQRTGALVGGAITALGAGAQLYSAAAMQTDAKTVKVDENASASTQQAQQEANQAARASLANTNQKLGALGAAGATTAKIGDFAQGIFQASASKHEAQAREHSARGQAASRAADVARSSEQEAKQMGEKAREAHGQLIALEHAGTMAVLRG